MPSKPNYNHQRAERDRAKKAAKETKLQQRKELASARKAGTLDSPELSPETTPEPEAAAPDAVAKE